MSIAVTDSDQVRLTSGSSHAADSLMAGLSFMLVANLLQRGIGFVRNIALCLFLADEQLGLWALASSFFVIAAPLAVLGMPGTFGRLVESYRISAQLNDFLRRVIAISSFGAVICSACLVLLPATSSSIIFGTPLSEFTMVLVALSLCLVIMFNAMTELLSGLRRPRVVSAMHTCNSLVFTVASLGGLAIVNDWRVLVVAFAIAALAGMIPAISTIRQWHEISPSSSSTSLTMGELCRRVLPLALSVWCMNLLVNLFDVVDRYMLLHLATETAEQGRALVGQFHSGRLMPALLASLTMMLSGMLLPYLVADWETKNRTAVHHSLRLTFKCASLFFFALSVASLAVSPWLFDHVLKGKYSDGLSIMPQALLHCCITALASLMHNYFWCAERGRTVGIMLSIGLAINVVLNGWWVPIWGLSGAMVATSVSGAAILLMTLFELRRSGVKLGVTSCPFALLPVTLLLGVIPSSIALALFMVLLGRTNWLFTQEEKRSLDQTLTPQIQRLGLRCNSLWPSPSR